MTFDSPWVVFVAGLLLGAALLALAHLLLARRRARSASARRLGAASEAEARRPGHGETSGADLRGRLESLANGLRELLLYFDADLVCRTHNEAVERVLGLAPEQIDGRALRDLLGKASYQDIEESIARVLDGEHVRLRQVHRNEEGQVLLFDARYVPHLDAQGRVLGFHALLAPATEQPFVEPRVQPLDHAGAEQAERAAEADAADAPTMPAAHEDPAQIEARRALFLEALHSGQFRLFEQSIVPVDRDGLEPSQHEILVRLRDEKERLVHPGAFLGIVSGGGFRRELDRWVIERLLRWYAKNGASLDAGSRIGFHVNLSSESIRDESFPAFLRAALQNQAIEPESLCFEIAEADVIAHRMEAISCAYAVRMLGCRVAVDRFGGATRSFSALVGMPADFVKIDGAIIGRILVDPFSRTKARAIAKVTQSMGARTIAERVEDADTLELLRTLGVDYAQGFGIAMPEPIERLAPRLDTRLRAGAPA